MRVKKLTPSLSRSVLADFEAWQREYLNGELPVLPTQVGSRLYAIPEGLPEVASLRVLHPGWWLGTPKKGRFEPAHALAMGLRPEDVEQTLLLPVDSSEAIQYLRCEPLLSSGNPGWVLVAIAAGKENKGFPLGWAKRSQGILKNHYPHGLQWL
jgi:NOL1/NOP2/fmu family ribosome biogenesis protein